MGGRRTILKENTRRLQLHFEFLGDYRLTASVGFCWVGFSRVQLSLNPWASPFGCHGKKG